MKLVITVKMVGEDGKALAAHESIINDGDEMSIMALRDTASDFVRGAVFQMKTLVHKGLGKADG